MGPAFIIFKQTVVMFLYMFAGYLLFRNEKISIKGSKDIASILVWLVIPAVIVNSFCEAFSKERLIEFLESSALAAASIGIAMAVAALIFKKDPIAQFGCSFSNAGFIGIPLIQAAFGDKAVFWMVGMVAMMNIMQWSYGVSIITGKRSAAGLKNIVFSPIMAGTAIGLLIFLSGMGDRLPDVITTTLAGVSSLNAPVAMIVLGTYLAQSDIKKMVTSPHMYWVCMVRLMIIPAVTLVIFRMIPFDPDILLAIFIAAGTPAGANVAVYAQLHDGDYPYACQTVTLSTLLSIITLPAMILLADMMI